MRGIVIVGLLVAAGMGCAKNDAAGTTDTEGGNPEKQVQVNPGESNGNLADRALRIASEHLQVPEDELQVVSVQAVDWPDSSIGCPRPGLSYMQVITPGHKVLVRHGDALVPVHFGRKNGFVCESGKAGVKTLEPRVHRPQPEQQLG